jgi:hypothetical protein
MFRSPGAGCNLRGFARNARRVRRKRLHRPRQLWWLHRAAKRRHIRHGRDRHCARQRGGQLQLCAGFNATLPCILTVTSGGTSLHSLAFAGGTFNTTPETELMLVYIASQLGTNESSLIAGFPSTSNFQQVLANQADVQAAQSAVVTNLQQRYAVTLTAPAFLTTSFAVGQAGVDSDLGALAAAGAIDANGMPDQIAVSLLSAAGLAHPLTTTSTPSAGTGGTSSTSSGMM